MAAYVMDPSTGTTVAVNITVATVIKTGPGIVAKVMVIVTSSGLGSVNDCATTGAVAVTNQLAAIINPAPAGTVIELQLPFSLGLVVTPGTGSTLSVSYS